LPYRNFFIKLASTMGYVGFSGTYTIGWIPKSGKYFTNFSQRWTLGPPPVANNRLWLGSFVFQNLWILNYKINEWIMNTSLKVSKSKNR
jgi:hypothetical protein